MAFHLDVTVRLFSDRYHGKEWPPSPARFFQALVAGAKTGTPARDWGATHQSALEWLESLGAPEIFAGAKLDGRSYTTFVPNNSLAGTQSTKTAKNVAPKILVNHSLGEPDVIYRWPVAEADEARAHLPALDEVAARLRALGWGIDFAAALASLNEGSPAVDGLERFTPDAIGGASMPVPSLGLLSHLDYCHKAFANRISNEGIDPYTRPTQFGQARYRRAGLWRPRRCIAFEMQTVDGHPFAARWGDAQTVASWLRHASGKALLQEELAESWVNSFVLGHTAPDNLGNRLSFVPLASIGHQHSDGGIRRVLVVEPCDASLADREALNLLRVKLSGCALFATGEKEPRAILVPPVDDGKVLPFFLRNARVWETVTPVILHGHNAARGRISLVKTDRLLRQAFDAAGFPESLIREMTFQRAPYWFGCEAATDLRVPRHLAEWPRVHVRVEFNEPVGGPVLSGIGRHYGIGVFAARHRQSDTLCAPPT